MGQFEPVTAGQRYGRLTVTRDRRRGEFKLACRCDCGSETAVWFGNARKGHTTSCGCAFRDAVTTHGKSSTRTYDAWQNMIARCTRPSTKHFENYGGRGITVCERWLASFEAFLADMGECPDRLTIDRVDNDGNYEPSNCRWVDRKAQVANRRKPKRRTACKRGHDVSTPGTYYESKLGHRHCNECRRMRDRGEI